MEDSSSSASRLAAVPGLGIRAPKEAMLGFYGAHLSKPGLLGAPGGPRPWDQPLDMGLNDLYTVMFHGNIKGYMTLI